MRKDMESWLQQNYSIIFQCTITFSCCFGPRSQSYLTLLSHSQSVINCSFFSLSHLQEATVLFFPNTPSENLINPTLVLSTCRISALRHLTPPIPHPNPHLHTTSWLICMTQHFSHVLSPQKVSGLPFQSMYKTPSKFLIQLLSSSYCLIWSSFLA